MTLLKYVNWNITNKCNLRCIHCAYSSGRKMLGELTTSEVKDIINQLAKMKCKLIGFSGGEPLIRDDIFELFKYVKERKIKIFLLTNGTLITKSNIDLIKNYVDRVNVSISGLTKETNDFIRGNGSFNSAIRTINLCKKNQIPVGVFFTVCKTNLSQVKRLFDFSIKYDIDAIKISPITMCGRALIHSKKLNITSKELESVYKELINKLTKFYNVKPYYGDWCNAGLDNLFFDPVGNIFPCADPLSFTKPIGNLRKTNIENIWKNSPILEKIRIEREKLGKIPCMYKYIVIKKFDIVKFSGNLCYFKKSVFKNST
jgi:MoaA/NifB/PqqE/SkfB family radical SAM enzyme